MFIKEYTTTWIPKFYFKNDNKLIKHEKHKLKFATLIFSAELGTLIKWSKRTNIYS